MLDAIMSNYLYYPSILAFLFGILIGAKYRHKIGNIFGYLILAVVIAYFLKEFPYYDLLPLSCTYLSAVIGIIIGNRLFRKY
ncbi:hypothetical protein [Methanocaldococcus fervens]|uniref:Uncharacterized protein n=1 Tax=Methanocaldococcus fervens (strain DSM 4213 / JCM 15782 / AG86) TaxID=573064 RepID=C7P5R4_METFA|nr:hypothetical protein [Methanocaldococcus fervens]ACV23896.1 hypothetical protein Mefer_0054 [Methanocaldococcus fervens AG86]